MHPEDFARWEAAREALFAGTGERLAMEVRYIVRGETRWHSLEAICRRDDTGKVIRWTGSTTDVTERKRAEEAQRESEQRYARVVSASDEAFWDWNAAVDELYRIAPVPRHVRLPAGDDVSGRAAFFKAFADFGGGPRGNAACGCRALRRKDPRMEIEIRASVRGEKRWIQMTGCATRDSGGQVVRWNGTIRDVTARKRAEEALRESEERYELAMAASESGYWDWHLPTDRYFALAESE